MNLTSFISFGELLITKSRNAEAACEGVLENTKLCRRNWGNRKKRSEDKIMLYELENDLTPCHQANYPTCNLAISPCKFCDARSELKHVSPLIHGPPSFVLKLCASKTSRRRRKKRREIKLILSKVLINVVCESQNYVNNLILHSARFHFTVVVF